MHACRSTLEDPTAGEISVLADKEQTVFRGLVHVERAKELIPLLSEVVLAPRFAQEDFERIRADMLNDIEKRLRATDDENLGKELLSQMLWPPGHPYRHYVGGTVSGLKAITLDDVKAHAAKVFGKKRLLIGLGGGATPELEEALKGALAALPEGEPRMASIPRVERPSRVRVLIAEKPAKAVAISMGYPHDAFRGHPDFSALALVASYLGEHRQFHGLLMQELREKRGMNYGDYAYVENFIQEGWGRYAATGIGRRRQHFSIWIRPVDPKDAVLALRLASYYLDRTITEGIPDSSVGPMRDFLTGYTLLFDLTPQRRLGYAIDDHFYGIKGYLERWRQDLQKLTKPEIDAAMRRHLTKGPLLIAMVAPDAEALKKEILSGAPSTKAYPGAVDAQVTADDAKVFPLPLGITEGDITIVKGEELFVR